MKKASTTTPKLDAKTLPVNYIPTNAQVEALAKLLVPEIKRFFIEERTQKKFNEWIENQNICIT